MKLQKTFGPLLLGGGLAISSQLLAVKPANAALLAQYTFTGNLNNSAPPNADNSKLSVTPFLNGAGLNSPTTGASLATLASNRTAGGGGNSRAITFARLNSGSAATAVTNNTYYSFKLTPANDFGTRFTNFYFSTDVGAGTTPNPTGSFFVQANIGAGNTFVNLTPTPATSTTVGSPFINQAATPAANFVERKYDLSGFAGGAQGYFAQPVEFRIYMYDNSAYNGGGLRVDNVRLEGTVAPVPELSTGLLVALSFGSLCIVGLRRKKSSAVPSMNLAF